MKVLAPTLVILTGLAAGPLIAQPLDTAFTYQGRLQDAGAPANGPYDFRFILYDAAVGGSQIGLIVTKDNVELANGLFTVSLDFGTSAFTGNKRWLDIAIRPGASGGTYTPLSDRQELQSTPNSVFSQRSPWTGITGKPPGFADDTDNDALGGVTCANGQVAKWNGAAWACGADLDTNSGGTVTGVATGAGLTGGPITIAGTVAVASGGITTGLLADGAVTSPKIAGGAVGLAQIDTGEVQARIATACPSGHYLRGINANGSVACEPYFAPKVITAVDDPANSVGLFTSIAIGSDGLPVISYRDQTAQDLKVTHCGNAACTAGNTVVTIADPANDVGSFSSIAIGADGLPVISYYDNSAFALKVAHCGNAACSAGNTITTVHDPANAVGRSTSIAIGADGLPVISYYDLSAGDLLVAHCGNPACTAGNQITAVDSTAANVGTETSIAIGADGLPVISYRDESASALKVAHCGNAACSADNTAFTVDPVGDAGWETSIVIGPDGLPVISYNDFEDLKFVHCGNADCTSDNTLVTLDTTNQTGWYTSIAIGSDGLPIISYYDNTIGALKTAHCGNATCTANITLTTVDQPPPNPVGDFTSIAIGTDGRPVISYRDLIAGTLKVARCATATCP